PRDDRCLCIHCCDAECVRLYTLDRRGIFWRSASFAHIASAPNVIDANCGKSFKGLIKGDTECAGRPCRFRHGYRAVELCQNLAVIPNSSCHNRYCHPLLLFCVPPLMSLFSAETQRTNNIPMSLLGTALAGPNELNQ